MALEVERKFLVTGDEWRKAEGTVQRQGYLSTQPERTVRVRIEGDKATLTIKGLTRGATRSEYEYDIPPEEAAELLRLCEPPLIEKVRRRLEHDGLVWEVDEFLGDNQGLVVARTRVGSRRPPVHQTFMGRRGSHPRLPLLRRQPCGKSLHQVAKSRLASRHRGAPGLPEHGGVAERFKAPVLKIGVRLTSGPRVRISPPPPPFFDLSQRVAPESTVILWIKVKRGFRVRHPRVRVSDRVFAWALRGMTILRMPVSTHHLHMRLREGAVA